MNQKMVIIVLVFVSIAGIFAQDSFYHDLRTNTEAIQSAADAANPANIGQNYRFYYFRDFYRKTLNANFLANPDYTGVSASLFQLKGNRSSVGFSMQFNHILTSNASSRQAYADLQPQSQYFFIPFLLNIKLHPLNRANSGNITPYLVAGFGPALGFYWPMENNFFRTLGAISGEIGGGGYAGLGVDYFWKEEWALSFEVRYSIFRFAHPLGEDQEYRGVTFLAGFSKAMDF